MAHNHWCVGFSLQRVTCSTYAWCHRDGDHNRGLGRHTECAFCKLVLTPAPLFWVMAEALVAQEEFLTWGQFQWHYRALLASQL